VLRSGWVTTGPRTKALEQRFAAFRGCRCAVATNSCTAALHLALLGLGVGPGDEVVTSPITFASTANVIVNVGATPVFCDVQPDTLNLDPSGLEAVVTPRTKAIIAVHFAGHPCDMDEILEIAGRHGVPVVEDAAHAAEAEYRGRATGSIGAAGAFSFYATKNMTSGEGGMLTTNDDALAERVAILGLHGLSRDAWKRYGDEGYKHWDVVAPGFKYNMSDIQAALADVQLDRLAASWARRKELVELYDAQLAGVPGLTPLRRRDYVKTAHHLYVVQVMPEAGISRDEFLDALQSRGVGVGVHFRAVHLHEFYRRRFGFARGAFPIAEAAGDGVISLPLYPGLTNEQVTRVAAACRDVLATS
jgi:dTDP-4-amino-4,6-dideoxygalactose transaminase